MGAAAAKQSTCRWLPPPARMRGSPSWTYVAYPFPWASWNEASAYSAASGNGCDSSGLAVAVTTGAAASTIAVTAVARRSHVIERRIGPRRNVGDYAQLSSPPKLTFPSRGTFGRRLLESLDWVVPHPPRGQRRPGLSEQSRPGLGASHRGHDGRVTDQGCPRLEQWLSRAPSSRRAVTSRKSRYSTTGLHE